MINIRGVIHGDSSPFSVRINADYYISDLRNLIHKDKIVEVFPKTFTWHLILWKLNEPEFIDESFRDRLSTLSTNLAAHATQLHIADKVAVHFSQVDDDKVQIIVEVRNCEWLRHQVQHTKLPTTTLAGIPPSGSSNSKIRLSSCDSDVKSPPSKRQKTERGASTRFLAIYKHFWKPEHEEGIFLTQSISVPDPLTLRVDQDMEDVSDSNSEPSESISENSSGHGAEGYPKNVQMMVIEHPEGPAQTFPLGYSKLLVPPIYLEIWDILIKEDLEWLKLQNESPGKNRFMHIHHATIITGQPGTGKTALLTVILVRRLVNGQPTIYCDSKKYCYIFDSTGVKKLALSAEMERLPELDDNSCLALVNLSDKLESVPEVFHPSSDRKARVVVATSPTESHWRSFSHEHPAKMFWMPTWTWDSLYFASLLFKDKDYTSPPDSDHCQRLQKAYSIFHGIPRHCFRSLTDIGLSTELRQIRNAICNITSLDNFMHVTSGHLPETSYRLVRMEPIDDDYLETRSELLSNYVAEAVFERLRLYSLSAFSQSLAIYLANPYTHSRAGILFEQAAHFMISRGLTLEMTCLCPASSLTVKIDRSTSETGTRTPDSRYYSLNIRREQGSQHVHDKFLGLYMTPILTIKPSIDALFISKNYDTTILFQMTVSQHYTINFRGLEKVFSSLPAKAKKNIIMVFVIPAQDISGEPYPGIRKIQEIEEPLGINQEILQKLKEIPQYVCALNLDAEHFL